MKKTSKAAMRERERLLLEAASLPVAAGYEAAADAFVERWAAARPRLRLSRDACGNIIVSRRDFGAACRRRAPLFITAHLDHPAFVVLSAAGLDVKLEFRGGVHDAYFKGAEIEVFGPGLAGPYPARITALDAAAKPFKTATARLRRPAPVGPGSIARWRFPAAAVKKGLAHAHACDDLAALAAALAAYDGISRDRRLAHAALLFTRAEEVGFVGAIGAARGGTIPRDARLLCLECSRSFPHDSPVGGGPIVRVGDRMSVFSPELTNAVARAAEAHAKANPGFRFQRKLMPGGACEASGFSFYGYRSTCLCLPLGNYHNMADIDGALAGKKARVAPEYVAVADFHGLVELIGAVAAGLDAPGPSPRDLMEKSWRERSFVLNG